MGRIKTALIKRKTREILAAHPTRFTKDFDKNKEAVEEVATFECKKMRNVITGYVTRLVKARK